MIYYTINQEIPLTYISERSGQTTNGRLDGWTNKQTAGQSDRLTDGQSNERSDRRADERTIKTQRCKNGPTDSRTDERTENRTNGWNNGQQSLTWIRNPKKDFDSWKLDKQC